MSAASCGADAPFSLGPDDRLHNSGWGRPPEQYRTPGIGTTIRLDCVGILRTWPGADSNDAHALETVCARRGRVPRTLVARYARSLTRALGSGLERGRRDDPLEALSELCALTGALGLTEGVVLTARLTVSNSDKATCPLVRPSSAEHAAVALTTAASCSPPLVLWGREPSLSLIRVGQVLLVRRLRGAACGPEAERVWSELQSLVVPGAAT